MTTPSITKIFNKHLSDFMNDVCDIFPDDKDLAMAKNSLATLERMNPKMIMKVWNEHIAQKYRNQIENGDVAFFIEKDYSDDLKNQENSNKVIEVINRLKEPIRNMESGNQEKTMQYVKNLSQMCYKFM